jgi:hypothetical protein
MHVTIFILYSLQCWRVCDLLEENLVWLLESHVYSDRYESNSGWTRAQFLISACMKGVVWILALA